MELFEHEKLHLERLRDYLGECTVLLKKDGSFPLEKAGNIALYGNGVRRTIKGGTGSGEVNSRFFVNIEEGLEQCGFNVTSKDWHDKYENALVKAKKEFRDFIKKKAKAEGIMSILAAMGSVMPEPEYDIEMNHEGEAAIYVLARISGEGSDRQYVKGDILLTDTEIRDINLLNEKYEKFMLVLNTGGPVDLSKVNEVKNILALSQLGVETGLCLGRILLGEINPSGKLTTTWASVDSYPKQDFGNKDDTRYLEGIYCGYRYFDSFNVEPLYPFGFGLSYTDFTYKTLDVSINETEVNIKVEVKNTGDYPGKEVIQIYVSKPEGILDHEYQQLVAFKKTDLLKHDEKQILDISFDIKDLSSFDTDEATYFLEKGKYIIRVGNSSRNTKAIKAIELDKKIIIERVKNITTKPDFKDMVSARKDDIDSIDTLKMSININEKTIYYEKKEEIDEDVEKLNDDDLALLSIGAFDPKGGIVSMIGSASKRVIGAAGETAEVKDIPILVMSDGPAGIRIAPEVARDRNGLHPTQSSLPATVLEVMPSFLKWLLKLFSKKPMKDAEYFNQYTTAIPIGTAIAQSFNEDLAYLCGDIVGKEMEIYGIDLWLAPALNIHRDIRCGRNFEYLSEDPYLSGVIAAALSNGVQSHKGRAVTIKHFCCNNQETNRTANNSIISERALREIYLKGFEICIKKADPAALMSSYNLLNGVHTSESYELIHDYLYRELDYKGIVMTDWVVNHGSFFKNNKYPGAYSYNVVNAGGTLFMPGGKKDHKELVEAIRSGKVSSERLKMNISRLFKVMKRLHKM